MNIYVSQFKDVLKGFYKKQAELNKQISANNEKYTKEYADEANSKLKEEQAQAYARAKANIVDIFNTVRGYLAIANFVNVEQLTADRLLFSADSSFDLSVDEVQSYVERYANNFTMLRLIKDWTEKQNSEHTDDNGVGKYASIYIIMPKDILDTYKVFAESALSVVDKVYSGSITQVADDNGTTATFDTYTGKQMNTAKRDYPLEVEAYGDESFASELYVVVGDGMKLNEYKSSRVPETAKHAFDGVILDAEINTR